MSKPPIPGLPIPGLPHERSSGQPIDIPAGQPPGVALPGELPVGPEGIPGDNRPGGGKIRMKEMPRMNARPYLKRAFKLLGEHKPFVALSLFFSLVMFLLPFVAAAAFGPLIKLFGDGAKTGNWNTVWTLSGSFYDKAAHGGEAGWFSIPFITDWLATPLSFTTIFVIWTCAIVLRNVLDIFRAWVDANLEQRLLTGFRQKLYEHIQTLSLDFFMGGQTGALMQRVLSETTAVQRLLTQVVLTPVVDAIVLIVVISYLLALSWQMTLVLFVMAPLTVLMFRFTGAKLVYPSAETDQLLHDVSVIGARDRLHLRIIRYKAHRC